MSGTLVTATIVAFARVPVIVQDYLDEATSGVIDEVTEVIPDQIDAAMPAPLILVLFWLRMSPSRMSLASVQ